MESALNGETTDTAMRIFIPISSYIASETDVPGQRAEKAQPGIYEMLLSLTIVQILKIAAILVN